MLKRLYTKKQEKELAELNQKHYDLLRLENFDEKIFAEIGAAIHAIELKADKKALAYYRKNISELSDDLIGEFTKDLKLAKQANITLNELWLDKELAYLLPFTGLLKSHDEKTFEKVMAKIQEIFEHRDTGSLP